MPPSVNKVSPSRAIARAESSDGQNSMALLALTHSATEHRLYLSMHRETSAVNSRVGVFSVESLMTLSGLCSCGTVRNGLAGLINKLSIERHKLAGDHHRGAVYVIFSPKEIFARRQTSGMTSFPKEILSYTDNPSFGLAINRVVAHHKLSRREAQIILCCAEGLTNNGIGEKLYISEQTVKFHLRQIFAKCGVKRRTELISRLLLSEQFP